MRDQKELLEVEDPAVEILTQYLGWEEFDSKATEKLRESLKEVVLAPKLEEAIRRINPWISKENIGRVVRSIVNVQATSVLEVNEKVQGILERGTTVAQDLGDGLGLKGRDVFLIDYENPENNEFTVVRQFRVEHHKENIPDLVFFVNGIPIVVIECKRPDIRNPIEEGFKQVSRYQEAQSRFRNAGIPQLFNTVQVIAVTCRDKTVYGTNYTPGRYWSEWKEAYPLNLDSLIAKLGRIPTAQDIFLFGVCSKENLLDLIRNFIVFERENGKTVKKLARYQQFRAVNKILKNITKAEREGGVIWHWQGSGKSLTMLWTAVKIRHRKELGNPTLVVITDRTDLDSQIHGTFERCGFPNPIKARNSKNLQELLSKPTGQTIMSTVQKFQDVTSDNNIYPVLTEESNIFVLVDEAHRSQYKSLAANMRRALPNACFIGFTGTPISKKNRDTFETFGPEIDRYDHNQSVNDGMTVPIYYESRMAELQIEGYGLEELFDRIFTGYSPEEKEAIKKKYITKEEIAASSPRLRAIALDLVKHYEEYIMPNGFKAQIVAVNRKAAIKYKEILDNINAPSSELLISVEHNETDYSPYRKTKSEEEEIIRRFKEEKDPKILVVCDKLTTGFDAPVEQVMYLDSPLKEHNLLQAMGRVNRKFAHKGYGLVVDYWGVAEELQNALKMYSEEGIEGMIREDYKKEILPKLQAANRAALDFFQDVEKGDYSESYTELCVRYLEPEDRRVVFDQRFKLFSNYMDMLLPDPKALDYLQDLKWLGEVRMTARNRYRDSLLSLEDCSEKVRKLIEDHIRVKDVTQLLEPTSIYSEDFEKELEKLSSAEAKASEIEHAIKHEISVRWDENPVFYTTVKELLEQIIEDARKQRIDSVEKLKRLKNTLEKVKIPEAHAQDLGVDHEVAPFYSLITENVLDKEPFKKVAGEIYWAIKENAVVDWQQKEDVKREMRRQIKRTLRHSSFPSDQVEDMAMKLMDLASKRFIG
ncbi:type I restriction endonuclease subunit R [Methanosarcina sp.]|uniref:type I restriction endonuclease subunit R n=1 Tax=Methanosarcina sp. TaxID=2213 RepID=UPI002988CDC8|nr:type I restriction endonuclease subunit R [Methanosarcina sp.]MDW5551645.1 type I restriction endonuclease subunit R [Methanosarcina sp.]MDW5555546.1 type I restriction endonuclease subunit R [Methanosarcina sp.]MDW5561104.1 type I restriction endonuclease subunit R [Methanosarcina sp.]